VRNAFVHGSYINRLSGEIEDRIQYTAEDLKSVAGPIPIPVGTVVTVLVAALVPLLEIIPILAAVDIALIAICPVPIPGSVGIVETSSIRAVSLSFLVSQRVSISYSLP